MRTSRCRRRRARGATCSTRSGSTHSLRAGAQAAPEDVQATLAELTVQCVARGRDAHANAARELLVCGGGARNEHLMRRIAALLRALRIAPTDSLGVPATQVEALAFAWLARQFVLRLPGNLATVPGAAGPRLLGALYPAM